MYIFLSHNFKDKDIVEHIALKLKSIYGQNNIFYDSWSIQPGEGIIDKMNEGLNNMDYFFFFISRNSLQSNMVKLEWQNAIYIASQNKCRFVPIKIDDCIMPSILMQNLYIDFYNNGIEVGFSQMMDVINGVNTFRPNNVDFNNVVCYKKRISEAEYEFEFSATRFVEQASRYMILFKENLSDVNLEVLTDSMFIGGPSDGVMLNDGSSWNCYSIAVSRATTPKLPVRIKLTHKKGGKFGSFLAMHSDSENGYKSVQMLLKS